ncbi:unnamed protein product [Owenia fusiformis]|uniref:Uncharacterized protein n=1 Tax=Owenia fusiformis TaxID=6347 RepID=A0A8J1YBU6_OWEFU|nr:unnamed protein product [Owenia fusiformis]
MSDESEAEGEEMNQDWILEYSCPECLILSTDDMAMQLWTLHMNEHFLFFTVFGVDFVFCPQCANIYHLNCIINYITESDQDIAFLQIKYQKEVLQTRGDNALFTQSQKGEQHSLEKLKQNLQ